MGIQNFAGFPESMGESLAIITITNKTPCSGSREARHFRLKLSALTLNFHDATFRVFQRYKTNSKFPHAPCQLIFEKDTGLFICFNAGMGLYSEIIFPKIYDPIVRHSAFESKRAPLLSHARGRILEIGIGTGLNLEFYPPSLTEISAIDISSGMEQQLRSKEKNSRIRVHFTHASADHLPFADNSFDTVVSTLTLCSLEHLPESLSEVRRVLKPDGQFLFLDHGLSPQTSVARWQHLLNPLQRKIACGCQLTVNVEKELQAAGFQIRELRKYYVEDTPRFLGFVYEGIADPAKASGYPQT